MKTYPLSESQLGIFYEWQRNPSLMDYNLPCLYRYSRKIHPDRLEKALQEVFTARPIFYTRIVQQGAAILQYQDLERPIHIQRACLAEAELDNYLTDSIRPFDLYADPLCRAHIIQTEQSVCLLLDIHHIITDGTTVIQLSKDLDAAYQGRPIEKETCTFYDYIVKEKEDLQTEAYQKAAQFYQRKFEGIPMSKIYLQPSEGIGLMRQISEFMSCSSVDAYCAENDITPNLLFLSAYSLTLSLFSKERKVAFYSVNHGRVDKRFRKTYGPFIKSTPMLATIDPESTVMDFIRSFKKEVISSVRYGVYPFTHFCRDLSVTPETSFAFQRNIEESVRLDGDETVFKQLPKRANQNLSVVIYHLYDQYEIRLEYNEARNTAYVMRQFVKAMRACIESLLRNPLARLKEVEFLSERDREEVLSLSRGETTDWSRETFLELFKKQTRLTPDNVAIVDHKSRVSYQELENLSDKVARQLIKNGIQEDDFVGIMLPREKEFMISVLGVLKAGAAYVPLASDYPDERLRYMLQDSEAKALITNQSLVEEKGLSHLPLSTFRIERLLESEEEAFLPLPVVRPERNAYMIYTSGSTGVPKGVIIQHKALAAFIQVCVHLYQLDDSDRIFCHSNFSFDASVEDLFPILTCGGELHILADEIIREPERIAEYIVHKHITGGNFTTQFGVEMLHHYSLPLKYITVGGERLDEIPDTKARFFNSYGPTEFTVDATFFEPEKGKSYASIPIGRPNPNTCAYVLNENGKLVPRGCVGELYLSGSQIAKGYWKREEVTKERFLRNPFATGDETMVMYKTGDWVRWNEQGELEYIGRGDNQIKLRGYRIEIGEIEEVLSRYEGITQAVVDVRRTRGTDHLCAYFTTNRPISIEELRHHLTRYLASYMIPSAFMRLERFPLNANGKIDRARLPLPTVEEEAGYVAPATEAEKALAHILQELLGVERIGVETDLFDRGLSSIQVMQVVFEAKVANIQTTVSQFYQYRTIRAIVKHAENAGHKSIVSWYDGFSEEKPVVVVTYGFTSYYLINLIEELSARYSVLVIESLVGYFNEVFQDSTDEQTIVDTYYSLIDALIPKRVPIHAFVGHCFGGELSYLEAVKWEKERGQSPEVWMIDTYAAATGEVLDCYIGSNGRPLSDEERDRFQETLIENEIQSHIKSPDVLPAFGGTVRFFKATRCNLSYLFPVKDPDDFLPVCLREIDNNEERWRALIPQMKVYPVDADHRTILNQKENIIRFLLPHMR